MTYNGFPNRETWAVSLTMAEYGWGEVAEDPINDWCVKHWDSNVPNEIAGQLIGTYLLAEDEFLLDLERTISTSTETLDRIDWTWIGENAVEAMAERRGA